MLETKQMVQQQELSLAARDYDEMTAELRLIMSGVAPGARSGASKATTAGATKPRLDEADPELVVDDTPTIAAGGDDALDDPLADLSEAPARRTRAERELNAEQRLAELKRRMGK